MKKFALELTLVKPVYAQTPLKDCLKSCPSEPTAYDQCKQACQGGFGTDGVAGGDPYKINVVAPPNLPTEITDIGGIVSTILGFAILIAAILAFLYLIWGGIQWITSGGDQSALEAARGRITASIVGLIIVGAAWGIFTIIQNIFGFTNILGGAGP